MTTDQIISQLEQRWKETFDQGQFLPPEELCAEAGHPELVDSLRARIRVLQGGSVSGVSDTEATGDPYRTNMPGMQTYDETLPEDVTDEQCLVSTRFRISRFLAGGGLGEVFIGVEQDLHREVALKFIRARHTANIDTCKGFLVEAEITAQLEHPGIVPVYGLGRSSDGRPFYAMRYIRGESFDKAIERFHETQANRRLMFNSRNAEFRSLLNRFISVCNTIAYAHNRGILHRDIKPQNIMLGKYSETLVVDWGLAMQVDRDERAKRSGEVTLAPQTGDSTMSTTGSGAGTPAYMSPEQANGDLLTRSSDIFSLGATLYKLLTGRAPFHGGGPREIMQKVKNCDFRKPTAEQPSLPRALEAICLKAMHKDIEQRYAAADDLGRDLEHWLSDTITTAYQETWFERSGRWMRQHRTWTRAIVTGIIATALIAGLFSVQMQRMAAAEQVSHKQSLLVAARFAAKTIAGEINRRWMVLEHLAENPQLREKILAIKKEAGEKDLTTALQGQTQKDLEFWLHNQNVRYGQTTAVSTWFITDAEGFQIARLSTTPARRQTLGENFAYRTYFHGEEQDLPATITPDQRPKPTNHVHRSAVLKSKTDGTLRVAFSAPIWSGENRTGEILGILAMTVDLNAFHILELGNQHEQFVALVDTRPDFEENKSGLFLQHPRLDAMEEGEEVPIRMDEELLEKLKKFRKARVKAERNKQRGTTDAAHEEPLLETDYRDPATPDEKATWLAAFEPVIVSGQVLPEVKDVGWIVIVQERQK